MDKSDDELLGAYIDGELAGRQLQDLEARLQEDAGLSARLAALRAADRATRELYAEVDRAPMPDDVLALIEKGQNEGSNIVAFPQRAIRRFFEWPVAVAASVALLAGFLLSDLRQQAPESTAPVQAFAARAIDSSSGLYDLLENSISGEEQPLEDDAIGLAVLTFEDGSGAFCRQLRVDTRADSVHGVACRRGDDWQLEAVAYAARTPGSQFQPASPDIPLNIIATVDALGGPGDPLETDQEKHLISKGWKKSE